MNVKANDYQIGGNHYKTSYEHWDLVLRTGMGYLEGCATKYVSRWRKKDGIKDLNKAQHYVSKMLESKAYFSFGKSSSSVEALHKVELDRFAFANGLTPQEVDFCWMLLDLESEDCLYRAKDILAALLEQAALAIPVPKPVPVEDSNRHAERSSDAI